MTAANRTLVATRETLRGLEDMMHQYDNANDFGTFPVGPTNQSKRPHCAIVPVDKSCAMCITTANMGGILAIVPDLTRWHALPGQGPTWGSSPPCLSSYF